MPAIAAEIRVQREHPAIGVQFGEPHQTGIGQRLGGVLVAAHQGFQRRRLSLELQRDDDDAGLNFPQHFCGLPAVALDEKAGLRQHLDNSEESSSQCKWPPTVGLWAALSGNNGLCRAALRRVADANRQADQATSRGFQRQTCCQGIGVSEART